MFVQQVEPFNCKEGVGVSVLTDSAKIRVDDGLMSEGWSAVVGRTADAAMPGNDPMQNASTWTFSKIGWRQPRTVFHEHHRRPRSRK